MSYCFSSSRQARVQRKSIPVWAYLHDPNAIDGPCCLFQQKAALDELAADGGLAIERYIVDSGSRARDGGRGAALENAISEMQGSGRAVLLLVTRPGLLAIKAEDMLHAVADLLNAGLAIKDATGELHPTRETIALAQEVSQSLRIFNRGAASACENRKRNSPSNVSGTEGPTSAPPIGPMDRVYRTSKRTRTI